MVWMVDKAVGHSKVLNFNDDWRVGHVEELRLGLLLTRVGIPWWLNQGPNFEDYDLAAILYHQRLLFEVKNDRKANETGRIAIEFWNARQDRPSGIAITKSNLWVIVLDSPKRIYVSNTEQLKSYILSEPGREVLGGDRKNSWMRLYPAKEILSKLFVRIDIVNPSFLKVILNELVLKSKGVSTRNRNRVKL